MNRRLMPARSRSSRWMLPLLIVAALFGFGVLQHNIAHALSAVVTYNQSSLVNSETSCSNRLAAENIDGRSSDATKRNKINDSVPYAQLYWITPKNQPTSPIPDQAAGQNFTLNLQLNTMTFICAIVVKPNSNRITPTGSSIVTNGNFPNDTGHAPNADAGIDGASLYEEYTRIVAATVTAGGGSLPGVDVGQVLQVARNNGSRYWTTNDTELFNYQAPAGGFADDTAVTITFTLEHVKSYHDYFGNSGTVTDCADNNGNDVYFENADRAVYKNPHGMIRYHINPANRGDADSGHQWGRCDTSTKSVSFQVKVNKPKFTNITNAGSSCAALGGDAVDNDKPSQALTVKLYDGATFLAQTTTDRSHGFSFARTAAMQNLTDWGSHTYTIVALGVNSAGRQDGQDSSTSVPVGPCADIKCDSFTSSSFITGRQVSPTFSVLAQNVAMGPPNQPGANPVRRPNFMVIVSGPGVNFNGPVAYGGYSSGVVTSAAMPAFVPAGGTYTIKWGWGYPAAGKTRSNITLSGSTPLCSTSVQSGYAPYFNVLGGDISAGNDFSVAGSGTCTSSPAAKIRSWNVDNLSNGGYGGAGSELGALATGDITGFTSGLGLSGGINAQHGYGLSFANSNTGAMGSPVTADGAGSYGGSLGSGSLACMPDYYANATGGPIGPTYTSFPAGTPGNTTYSYSQAANLTIGTPVLPYSAAANTMTLPAGATVNIYVKGNVYIASNIEYGAYGLSSVPRFNLYVSGSIYIAPNVTELHGVYSAQRYTPAAGGAIYTCGTGYIFGDETTDYVDCGHQLKFVGAVFAGSFIRLDRTIGSYVAATGITVAPAETFQYDPELWLASSSAAAGTGPFDYYTSLPPVL